MAKASVTLRGRFPAGSTVRLVRVRDESVQRAEGGEEVDVQTVDRDGVLSFTKGVEVGARYIAAGLIDGFPREVRIRGNAADDDQALAQAPIGYDRTRLSDGSFVDEAPEKADAGFGGVGPAPSVQQARGQVLRSDTARGYAHPVDTDEQAPYPPQGDDLGVQRSDTPEGAATPIAHEVPASQSEVRKGTVQRSDTPMGVATPIPHGDAVDAMRDRESAQTKASVGEPGKAAAHPPEFSAVKRQPDRDPAVIAGLLPVEDLPPAEGADDQDGLDGQGQPVAGDVAAAAGTVPADKPAEPVRAPRNSSKEK